MVAADAVLEVMAEVAAEAVVEVAAPSPPRWILEKTFPVLEAREDISAARLPKI